MTLIADSGSTKTTWMEVESGNKIVTEGLNPHFTSDEAFLAACTSVCQHFSLSTFDFPLHFYGAGCGNPEQRERVAKLMAKAFGTSDIHVETDMLGACRATWGDREGLVGILGTGSNAAYYDGQRITHQAPSLGYILGDHGSAGHVGRLLLTDYLTDKMPDELSELFAKDFPWDHDQWIDALYHRPAPNRFLASLAPFAINHLDDDYCRNTVEYALDEWHCFQLAQLVLDTDCRRLCVVGSFGYAARHQVAEMCDANGLRLGTVVADPIEGLREYHIKKI